LQDLEPERVREFAGHLSKFGLKREYSDYLPHYGPWYVWDFGKKGQPAHFLLFEARKKMRFKRGGKGVHLHPSTTPICMTLLDDSGKVIAETDLATGWRCYLKEAGLQSSGDKDYPLVRLETELGSGAGPDIGRQYYAWLGQRFDLVRLENSAGKAIRNRYYLKHFRSGPRVAALSEAEWEADLLSKERARVLRALVWLGGLHWDLKADGNEAPDQVRLWRQVRAREKVAARIQELLKSDDPWLREAAQLAAAPEDGHF
jgi:hypothetical protein